MFDAIRYNLIELLVGDMPVVINMTISKPNGYKGAMGSFPCSNKPGLVTKNHFLADETGQLLTPSRDINAQE